MYVNDLEKRSKSPINYFVDDTSLFSPVYDPKISVEELNHDLN